MKPAISVCKRPEIAGFYVLKNPRVTEVKQSKDI